MSITLKKSKRPNKKYVVDTGDKKIYFGDSKYRDFLLINDEKSKYYEPSKIERENIKSRYRRRHRNDNLDNPFSAGALSYYLLWGETSLRKSIQDFEKRFNIKIIVK
jgi:hypothetical protein